MIAIHRASWKPRGKSETQWRTSLTTYAFPRLGRKRVDKISTSDVMACLVPIWGVKRETARRVKQRISAIMRWCIAQGYRSDDPAGVAIDAALPRNGVISQHHRALPYGEVSTALDKVRGSAAWDGTKLAFEFLVLTAARSGEVPARHLGRDGLRSRHMDCPCGENEVRT